ncbi:N-acetyl-gamma-glutamyl-phosphate reductase [Candidatus Aerophobetes bacterium]|uniref:N-acetyl-gamma-glutamyl-phosphate reductase n=1 Tax=Aerophobetes bacterium TaxID=2030807 RepID=A0A497E3K8_UNCAE|nr:MAG: N-acetyl-gamma-glutamyl-phosphate reductase [Candidatus Aerophobetes bacterium]
MKVSVIGATGYTGAELVRILSRHPEVELVSITSQTFAGKKISEIYPFLSTDLVCEELDVDKIASSSSFVFTALPHKTSMEIVGELYLRGKRVVDLSADFRLKDPALYEKWYGVSHSKRKLLHEAVYGLPELYREKIREARLVANPGCYPTSIILALAPLLKSHLIKEESIIVDAKSGVTGAGRKLTLATHFPEINENFYPYKVEGHRHLPEMEQELSRLAGTQVKVTFVPHLAPLNRGILSTCYASLKRYTEVEKILRIYRDFYKDEPFVEILEKGKVPRISDVATSNRCRIGLAVDERTDRIIVISAIDNLGKGASGQAVQNMNIMCGFKEDEGLK